MSQNPKHDVVSFAPLVGILAAIALLGWEAGHGGVKTHHLLARGDMPGISNWWALFVLPLLGGLTSFLIRRRRSAEGVASSGPLRAFLGALVVGVALSVLFVLRLESATSTLFLGVFAIGLVLPIYRVEYGFGFVIGMCFVFGPVIPVIAASVIAVFSAFARLLLYPIATCTYKKLRSLGRA